KPSFLLSPFRWLTAAALISSFGMVQEKAMADNVLPFVAGTVAGAVIVPYLMGYQGNSLINFGTGNNSGQLTPVVYNTPTPMPNPMMVPQPHLAYTSAPSGQSMPFGQTVYGGYQPVNYQPAIVYSSVPPASPQPVNYAGPAVMPYILVR
ncbi:MAG: hypothetical protein HQL55_10750, partial [Magnetococcales bacterium]|nr:hypothetical protein [Magnetococcales bacterium]